MPPIISNPAPVSGDWTSLALCRQVDPAIFYPEKGQTILAAAAKRVCLSCEVRAECLDYALANDERFGVWGGLSERQRRRIKRQQEDAAEDAAEARELVAAGGAR